MRPNPLLLSVACLLGLVSSAFGQGNSGLGAQNAIPWRTYKSDMRSRVTMPKQVVIQTGANWQGYWNEVTGQPTASAPKDIDFTKEIVAGIHLGIRPTHGYEVYVEGVRQTGPYDVTVYYVEATPPPGRLIPQEQTSPWVMVRLPRVPGIVHFSKRTVVGRPGIDWGEGVCHCCCYCSCSGGGMVVAGVVWSGFPSFSGNPFDPLQNIQWRTFRQGGDSRFEKFETNVMDNEASWQSYWARNTRNPPQTAPKNVDWLKQRLIAINAGTLGAGASVYVESVNRKNAANIEIVYVVTQRENSNDPKPSTLNPGSNPTPNTQQPTPLSSPYVVIAIDRVAGIPTYKRKDIMLPRAGKRAKCECGCGSCRFGG